MSATDHSRAADRQRRTPPFWVTRRGARIALVLLHAAALIAVLVELFHPFPQDGHAVERLHALDFPASYSVYGFVACVLLVLVGILLRRAVMRDEGYYDGDGR
jgi:hypothetical protein